MAAVQAGEREEERRARTWARDLIVAGYRRRQTAEAEPPVKESVPPWLLGLLAVTAVIVLLVILGWIAR